MKSRANVAARPHSKSRLNHEWNAITVPAGVPIHFRLAQEIRRDAILGAIGGNWGRGGGGGEERTRVLSEIIIRITAFRTSKPIIAKVREKCHVVRGSRSGRKGEIIVLRKRRNGIRPGIPEEQVILPPC